MSIIDKYLEVLSQGSGRPIRYSDAHQFEKLWSDAWPELAKGEGSSRIVIVWDGAPSGHKLLMPHLTPLDWALAASLGLLNSENPERDAQWSLHIVDLSFGAYRNTDNWSVLHAASLLDAMPWVRLYGPLQLKRRAYDPRRLGPIFRAEWNDVPTMAVCLRDRRKIVQDELRRLTQSWQGSIQRSDDHHDLNNLVAPALLSREYAEGTDDVALRTFARKCRWIDAIPASRPDDRHMAEDVKAALAALPGGGTVRVTMVDDMAERGWGALVRKWLGAPQAVPFEAHTSPLPLVNVLKRRGPDGFRRRDYSRSVWAADGDEPVDEVLIWDLRLFGKGDVTSLETRRKEEQSFYGQLVGAIRHCDLIGTTDLAWPGFTSEEIDEVEKWCDPKSTGEPPEAALTLAPRCMALLSPTTPIILLSSTGRRSVVEAFKAYGNILTGVEKLRPLDRQALDLSHLRQQWQQTWGHVSALLGIRQQLRAIEEIASHHKRTARTEGNPGKTYVEIYVDESGTYDLVVGGVIAVFSDADGCEAPDKFDDELFSSGVCYFDPLGTRKSGVRIKPKEGSESNAAAELLKARKAFEKMGRHVSLFRFSLKCLADPGAAGQHRIARMGDYRYFQTAATALELLLYDALPLSLSGHFTVSVYIATRQLADNSLVWREAVRNYGYDRTTVTSDGSNLVESVGGASVLPVIARIITERPSVDPFLVHRAMGVTLRYERQTDRRPMIPNRFVCRNAGCMDTWQADRFSVWSHVRWERRIAGREPLEETGLRSITQSLPARDESGPCTIAHRWRPDIRALHYLADQVLKRDEYDRGEEGARYADVISEDLPGFEDKDDLQLRDLILASRLADRREHVLALVRALTAIGRGGVDGLSQLRRVVTGKLAAGALKLSGVDLFKVAYALPWTPNRPPGSVRAARPPKSRKSDSAPRSARASQSTAHPEQVSQVQEAGPAANLEETDCSITIRTDKLPAGIEPSRYAQETLKLRNAHCEASKKSPRNIVIRFRALQQDAVARDAIKTEHDAKRVVGFGGQTGSWIRWQA